MPQLYSILLFSAPLYSSLRYSTLLYSALLLSALLCSALLYSSDNGFQTTSLLQKHAKWTSDFRAYFSTSGTCQLDWMTSLLLLYLRNMQLDSMTSVLLLLEEHANWTRTSVLLLYLRNMHLDLITLVLLLYLRSTPTGLKTFWKTIRVTRNFSKLRLTR